MMDDRPIYMISVAAELVGMLPALRQAVGAFSGTETFVGCIDSDGDDDCDDLARDGKPAQDHKCPQADPVAPALFLLSILQMPVKLN